MNRLGAVLAGCAEVGSAAIDRVAAAASANGASTKIEGTRAIREAAWAYRACAAH